MNTTSITQKTYNSTRSKKTNYENGNYFKY